MDSTGAASGPSPAQLEPTSCPTDVLAQLLRHLAFDGDDRAFQRLAFLTCNSPELIRKARTIPRPLIVDISFDGSDEERIFKIPFYEAKIADVDIFWGDGTIQYVKNGKKFASHQYAEPGEYRVHVFPSRSRFSMTNENDEDSTPAVYLDYLGYQLYQRDQEWWRPLTAFVSLGQLGISSLAYLFADSEVDIPLDHLDVSNITDMNSLFCGAKNFNHPLDSWNVSKVTNMSHMFHMADVFNQPLYDWDVSSVTTMTHMFYEANLFDQPLGRWNVGRVTSMSYMFARAYKFNHPIGDWDVSNVQSMNHMFSKARAFNQPIGDWNVGRVKTFQHMLSDATVFNQPIGRWDVSSAVDMHSMFRGATAFNQSIGDWNVGNVSTMRNMFYEAVTFNRPIGKWNVSKVESMRNMFVSARMFNQPIGSWDTSNVLDMSAMFSGASAFNQPIGDWNVRSVENVTYMFAHAIAFNQPIDRWNAHHFAGADHAFIGASSFKHSLNGWGTTASSSVESARIDETSPAPKAQLKAVVLVTPNRGSSTKKVNLKFTVDCTKPAHDGVMDVSLFEKFLHDHTKVNGKAGNLANSVKIAREGPKIHVTATVPFSKRYLKYLTKKYLQSQKLRDWLHVVATSKPGYEIRYYNIQAEAGENGEQ
jgi:surface protein